MNVLKMEDIILQKIAVKALVREIREEAGPVVAPGVRHPFFAGERTRRCGNTL
jgi:hypothetical protein